MQNSTQTAISKKLIRQISCLSFLMLLASFTLQAQQRAYSLIYSENIKGNTTMFGNSLLHILKSNGSVNTTKMNSNSANGNTTDGNDDANMQHIDIDGTTGIGAATRNSSSADLILPAGTNTIKLARLYWGGRITTSDYDLSTVANQTVKIRKGTTNNYTDVVATGVDQSTISSGYSQYQAYADVTTFIKQNGAGTYTIGNVPLSTGAISGGGNHGGWTIVVVYENDLINYNSVRVYDGFQKVYNDGSPTVSTVTLTGLDVPSGALAASDAQMGVMAWEGDANIYGDFLKINGNTFSNGVNQSDNPWNGTISNNGVHVTTKNPNYTNQMGIDIDMFNVGTGFGISPNDNSVTLQFGTEADQYYPGLFTFSLKMKDPTITLEKLVSDANGNHLAEVNEILTYTLKGSNTGVGNANFIELIDTLPNTVTYVANSLKVISAPGVTAGAKTDASNDDIAEYIVNGTKKTIKFRLGTGATSTLGGTLAENETYEVQFQVKVNVPAQGGVPSIMNIARVSSKSDAEVVFTDDATAIINPEEGPLPVTLEKFTATLINSSRAQIDWSTSMEINCSRYIVQKSYDGNTFTDGTVVAGHGTTNLLNSYSITDDVSAAGNMVYYRLKQIDLDGKVNLSKVIAVKLKKENQVVSVSPNPFTNYLNVNMEWSKSEVITARVINIQGKEVASKSIQVTKGVNYVRIDELSKLPSGNYFLQFISATERFTQKVTK
ncbi:MAG: T9SS type A sorting domain-containing protein [Ginsengibacter sp.]